MCPHNWRKANDVFVCIRCGITRLPNGGFMFDRELPNVGNKKRRNTNGRKKQG